MGHLHRYCCTSRLRIDYTVCLPNNPYGSAETLVSLVAVLCKRSPARLHADWRYFRLCYAQYYLYIYYTLQTCHAYRLDSQIPRSRGLLEMMATLLVKWTNVLYATLKFAITTAHCQTPRWSRDEYSLQNSSISVWFKFIFFPHIHLSTPSSHLLQLSEVQLFPVHCFYTNSICSLTVGDRISHVQKTASNVILLFTLILLPVSILIYCLY
jgi:hypothetical protein